MHRYTCRSPQAPKPSPVSITFLLSISQSTSPSLSVFLTLPHTSSQGRSLANLIQNLLRGFYPLKGSFSLSLLPLLTETSGSLNSLFTTLCLVAILCWTEKVLYSCVLKLETKLMTVKQNNTIQTIWFSMERHWKIPERGVARLGKQMSKYIHVHANS